MNRENGACPVPAPAGRRRAAKRRSGALGLGHGDRCENLGLNPMNRENGACPVPAGRRRAATVAGVRVAGAMAADAKFSDSIP